MASFIIHVKKILFSEIFCHRVLIGAKLFTLHKFNHSKNLTPHSTVPLLYMIHQDKHFIYFIYFSYRGYIWAKVYNREHSFAYFKPYTLKICDSGGHHLHHNVQYFILKTSLERQGQYILKRHLELTIMVCDLKQTYNKEGSNTHQTQQNDKWCHNHNYINRPNLTNDNKMKTKENNH